MSKRVIIYRDQLLPYSETFIPAQVENFLSYEGIYVGVERFQGNRYPLPPERTLVLSDVAKITPRRRILFLASGGWGYKSWFQQLKNLSPCLIHAHFGPNGVWALPIQKNLKIPLVVTFHGYDITVDAKSEVNLNDIYGVTPLPQLYFWRRNKLFKKASYCIAVSEFIRTQLISKGCPPDKVVVHYIGVDTEKFCSEPNLKREPIILGVGRLVEKKGYRYLLKAMAQVQSVLPELKLVLIGDGELRAELEQQAKSTLKNFQFLGVQSPNEVKNWMNRSLMLCAPSVTDTNGNSEGLPITILEAQAMNLPVVSSIHSGIPEAVIDGETGFLAPEKDWNTLAEKILTLARNHQLQEQFAKAGRQQIEYKFNLKSNTKDLERLYDSILEQDY